MANITDLLTQAASTTTTRPVPTQVTSVRAIGGGTLACNLLTGWPTTTAVHFITYRVDTAGNKVAGTQIDLKGVVSGSSITNVTLRGGTDNGNAIGDIVEAAPTAAWADDLYSWGINHADQDGTLKAGAVDVAAVVADGVLTAAKSTVGTNVETRGVENFFNYIASGCVWTADAAGSTRNASMTAGVIYIRGKRLTVSAVTARTFTASRDTYVDLQDNGDGTGSITYTEATNNAASSAIPNSKTEPDNIRNAIIVTGASNIANAGSINQGQENIVLPIASSVPYTVTDSLGNLICPRDPNRRVLGYRQIITGFSSSATSATQITGLSVPVTVPTARKISVKVVAQNITSTSGGTNSVSIWDGTVGSGTQIGVSIATTPATQTAAQTAEAQTTPATTSKTYNAGLTVSANTSVINASTGAPVFIKVELA